MNCPICNSTKFQDYIKVEKYSIFKCIGCGHSVTENCGTDSYDEDYFLSHYETPEINTKEFAKKIREQQHRVNKVKSTIKNGLLLDIGCGMGHFMYAAKKRGYDVFGYDFVDTNKDYINEVLGIDVCVSIDLSKATFDRDFQVVTSWHSLEHSENPKDYLHFTRQVLCKKGVLVIEVPTHDCIDAYMMGSSWPNWDPPFHKQHFTEKSFRNLLENNGYQIFKEYSYNCNFIRQVINKSWFSLLDRPISKLFRGSSVAFICKKI